MWTLLSAVPLMRTAPEAVASSRRSGPETSRVRSNVPCSVGPKPQAASEADVARRADRQRVRAVIRPPAKEYAFWAVVDRYGNWEGNVPGERPVGNRGKTEASSSIVSMGETGRFRPVWLCSGQDAGPTTSNAGEKRTLKRTLEGGVEGALAVAFEVERDVEEAGGFEARVDSGGQFGREGAKEVVGRDFDAREFVMQANAGFAEAEVAEGGLRAGGGAEGVGGGLG